MSSVATAMRTSDAVGQPEAPPRRFVAMLILVLGTLTATGPLATDLYLPAFPAIAHDLHAPQSQIQLTLTSAMFGLALGQLLIGPMSDAWGRRKPLLIGLAVFTVTSLLCMFVPSAGAFIALRFVQGMAGAAGAVISRAIVRDHFDGDGVARFFSRLVLVSMLAPMLGPILGAQLLNFGSWHLGFAVLTVVSLISLALVFFLLPESLPVHKRQDMNLTALWTTIRRLLGDARFIGPALTLALVFGMMFTYISTFSFVSQTQFGATAQQYSLIFAINTIGLLVGTQVNGFLIGRMPTLRRLSGGIICSGAAIAALAIVALSGTTSLIPVTATLFVMMFGAGMIFPNCTAMALGSQPKSVAGTGSALLGTLQFAVGGSVPATAAWTASGTVSLDSMVTVMVVVLLVAVPVFAVSNPAGGPLRHLATPRPHASAGTFV